MELIKLGLTQELSEMIMEYDPEEFSAGRVTRENKERYVVSDGTNEYDAEITGNLRFSARSRSDFPAVGDWVIIKTYNSEQAIIYKVLPRKSLLTRQAVGKFGEEQIISANIDLAFIVQAINNNFNLNRLERYLTICYSAKIEPVLILSKTDLVSEEEINDATRKLEKRYKKIKYFLLSNVSHSGLDGIKDYIKEGMTCCVIGSSGVGKSSFINNLLEMSVLKTGEISSSTHKGKHITEHREMFLLNNGGIIIDNPGMRELGVTENPEGVKSAFGEIDEIGLDCRFSDCKHINEKGCAVIEALDKGIIDLESYNNYQKIIKEQERFKISIEEKHRRDKMFGKMIKNYYKDINENPI
jgi:ribosome biogenesis GTPase